MAQSPFKLFEPYGSQDKDNFFGRDNEIFALYNLLQQTRLVLIYGASGTGKTSLIHAGLPKVFKLTDWYRLSVRRKDDINVSFRNELARLTEQTDVTDIGEGIEMLYESRWIPIYLVFDQFEELFTLGNHDERVQFFKDLQTLLEKNLPCKIILSMREEYIGHLYEYEPVLPLLFEKRFRVEPMKDATVRQVIEKMCATGSVELADGTQTVEQILQQVKEGKQAVHLPYLQVYLHYLYENAKQTTGKPVFNKDAIELVGKLGNVLKGYIESQLAEAEKVFTEQGLPENFAGRLLDEFATDEGTKQSRKATELASTLHTEPGEVRKALEYFTERKLLRADENDVERYEPVHDVVAKQIHELRSSEDIEFKTFVRHLQLSHDNWQNDNQADVRLLNELDLNKATVFEKPLRGLSDYENRLSAFIDKSRAHIDGLKQKEKRRRQILIIITAAAVIGFFGAIGLGVWAIQKRNEAVLAKEDAVKKTLLAQRSDSIAQIEKNNAVIQTTLADKKKIEVLLETKNTEKALTDLRITSDQAVTILLIEIDRNILNMEYDFTYDKCKTAVNLKAQQPGVEKRLQEIAYFYTEGDTLDAALKILALLNIKPNRDTASLHTALKKINATYFAVLEEHYYPTMIKVDGGTFMMGQEDTSSKINNPAHQVTLDAFSIAKTETTVWQYFVFLKAKHDTITPMPQIPGWQWQGNNPIVNVNWYDAVAYNDWLSTRTGKKYRLPTEAEWEFAARGGKKSNKYVFSGSNSLNKVAWNGYNYDNKTHPVATKDANELGIHDMSGNVSEWCSDWYFEDYYTTSPEKNPKGPKDGGFRVLRGGSFSIVVHACLVFNRDKIYPYRRYDDMGFRCAGYD